MEVVLIRTGSGSVSGRTGADSRLKFNYSSRSGTDSGLKFNASLRLGTDSGLKFRVVSSAKLRSFSSRKLGVYYEEMLKCNPSDSLLLRNYGKYLHEVEGDMEKAEGCYGRAILASPGDGEVLSLYGKLIWEKEKDELRAKSYFDQALNASPHDCMVLGSYAQFMWEAEEDEEDEIASSVEGHIMAGVY